MAVFYVKTNVYQKRNTNYAFLALSKQREQGIIRLERRNLDV